MDLRRLRYFLAVAEELHFGRAAQRMHVVQSAVSHQVKLLEQELGFSVLERSRHNVRLTVSGEIFLPEARDLLRRADEAMRRARASADGTVGRLAIGFVDNILWTMLPPIIRDFLQRWPQVELTLHPLDRSAQIEALRTSVIDIGIMPSPSPGHALKSVALAAAPLVAAIPEGHPLAARSSLSLVALASEPFVLFPRKMNSRLLEIIVACCASAGFAPRIVQEAEQLHTLLALVSAGLGVTLVPEWVARIPQLGVIYIPVDDLFTPYELIAAWNSGTDNPAVPNFRETAAGLAGQMLYVSPSR
ncbi:LysR substrate-binding domain-containing protein [Paraburkholderia silviterrae]|uniref:LysR family transcriptional regulator n=1 Tax=Paraburkholderia silviterrae TaxID=2528715 RepID=A0A4R5M3B1_9BURK|nr:LysR substrate-binding domain-containing protein [Paraburkholderia silviterrae]TDG20163.1 LysR family transcriptional regulator [Paraburkholderia silviterrae]